MPIRFRCKYCYQLLGIARRKAGTAVQCPTCRGKLTVPATDSGDPAGSGGAPEPAAEPDVLAFERSDFDDYLKEPYDAPAARHGGAAASASQPVPAFATAPPPEPVLDVEPLAATPLAPAAIVLSPAKATVLAVAVICLLALAFAAGVAVDRWFLQP